MWQFNQEMYDSYVTHDWKDKQIQYIGNKWEERSHSLFQGATVAFVENCENLSQNSQGTEKD
jgi:hypothetical protein